MPTFVVTSPDANNMKLTHQKERLSNKQLTILSQVINLLFLKIQAWVHK